MGGVVYGSLFCIVHRPCTELLKGTWTVVESQTYLQVLYCAKFT